MTSVKMQEKRVGELLRKMTLREKLGQMWQVHGGAEEHKALARQGAIGSILNLTGSHMPDAAKVANAWTLRDILKGEWGFDGFVVSDWGSITEMIQHG
jgi:beta-glucosidase-like glycosyl hydrolase